MRPGVKIILYVVLALGALFFGARSYQIYHARATASASRFDQAEIPSSSAPAESVPLTATNTVTTNATVVLSNAVAATETNTAVQASTNVAKRRAAKKPKPTTAAPTITAAERRSRFGLYGALAFGCVVALGILLGRDLAEFIASRAHKAMYNEDGDGLADPGYDLAEETWANGDYLGAIHLLRDHVKKHPREIHALIRIAEIYENDLRNPLAAALEYEDILTHKLPAERWGWSAIHLANLYSGKLDQPQKALALLRRIDAEYGQTSAAGKARKRLAAYEASGLEVLGEVDVPPEALVNPPTDEDRRS